MARSKSDILSAMGVAFEVMKVIVNDLLDAGGGDDNLRVLLTPAGEEKRAAINAILLGKPAATPVEKPAESQVEYFTAIADADVPEKHAGLVAKYRALATEHGVPATTAVCYRVQAGFTLKNHASKAGPCNGGFNYLQDWNFKDVATREGLVFWVPCLLKDSTSKTVTEQEKMLAQVRRKLELPAYHMSSLGAVALVSGLILAHHKATGERLPANQYWARTDTCDSDGLRLRLGDFDDSGLCCYDWRDDNANDYIGVFALGVELGS